MVACKDYVNARSQFENFDICIKKVETKAFKKWHKIEGRVIRLYRAYLHT